MEIFHSLDQIPPQPPCSLALGTFDGLHRGHMAVLRAAVNASFPPAVFTFSKSPSGERAVLTPEDKVRLMEQAGADRLYSMEFSALRDWEAGDFVREVLLGRFNARRICCGPDFRFGRGAAGNVELLRDLCARERIQLEVVPPVLDGGEKVSSTRIRRAVEQGEISLANRLLGRPFGFALEVIHGNHIGTGLGTPTINQALPEDFVLPRFGVYAVWCRVEDQYYYGVCNVGVKPTVGSDRILAETWMPDFSGDLYGRQVRLFLVDFIRAEKKFSSLEELKEEIRRNSQEAKAITGIWGPPKD